MATKSVEKSLFWASRKLDAIAGVALVAMMALIAVNVIMRAVWLPITGTYEVTAFLASVTIAFALANCAVEKGHIALTLFAEKLPARGRALCDAVVSILGSGLFLVLAWEVTKYAIHTKGTGEVGMTTELPFYPFIFGVAFGLLMLALVLLIDLYKSIARIIKP